MLEAWDSQLRRRFPDHDSALYRIAELEDLVLDTKKTFLPPRIFGLKPMQTRITHFIAQKKRVSLENLKILLWGESEMPASPIKNIQVHIHHLRKALEPHGIKIKTVWGEGFEMDKESLERWFAAVESALMRN